MKIEWMGRYREFMKALVLHSNMTARVSSLSVEIGSGISLTPYEWQVFECILEHEDENVNMISMSNGLGVPQSTFSKIVQKLCRYGVVERYQTSSNRKNIILKGTEKGRSFYLNHSEQVLKDIFQPLFSGLDSLSDEAVQTVAEALCRFNQRHRDSMGELHPVAEK